jgi:opacity protein-like surface antigen
VKIKLLAGCALAASLAASAAAAQTPEGWYGALDLGWHRTNGLKADASGQSTDGRGYNWNFDTEDDFVGFARLGYRLNPSWRVELEGGYRGGELETVRGGGPAAGLCAPNVVRTAANPTCRSPEGSIESWTLMMNVLFDLLPPESRFRPFVGVGAGFNRVNADVFGQFATVPAPTGPNNPPFQNLVIDDESVALAVQGILGVAYQATERLTVDLTYRYLTGRDVEFAGRGTANLQPGTFSGPYEDQSLTLGLRYAFAAPPPPPLPVEPEPVTMAPQPMPEPVAPQPQPQPVVERPVAREFVVYFPFDQSVLTPEAQTVVQEAASYAQRGGATQVQVVGHADTSGSARYNVRLSERRARAGRRRPGGPGRQPRA